MTKKKPKRIINISVLPGEPLDGRGRVCIHLFVCDPKGSFVEPSVMYPVLDENGKVKNGECECRPTHGRLACNPRRNPTPTTRGNVITVTPRSIDTRAVTCPKCIATEDYKKLAALEERANGSPDVSDPG